MAVAISLVILDVPFEDTAAEQLRIVFDGQIPDTLYEVVVSHPNDTTSSLTLGAPGALYVVFVGKRENPFLTEGIPCITSHGVPLSGVGAMMKACVENLSPETFTQRTNTLRRELRVGYPHSIVAEFPGSPSALAVLSAEPTEQGYRWNTWRGYSPRQLVWTSNTWTAVVGTHGVEVGRVKGGS